MQFGDVVELKSGGPKMRVEWEIGAPTSSIINPLGDRNEILKKSTGYNDGDNLCAWSYRKKLETKVFPVEALIMDTSLVPATNQVIEMGSVVKINGENQHMTVNWVIGKNCRPTQLIDIDQLALLKGYSIGDVSCVWFNRGKLKESFFKAERLVKIFE